MSLGKSKVIENIWSTLERLQHSTNTVTHQLLYAITPLLRINPIDMPADQIALMRAQDRADQSLLALRFGGDIEMYEFVRGVIDGRIKPSYRSVDPEVDVKQMIERLGLEQINRIKFREYVYSDGYPNSSLYNYYKRLDAARSKVLLMYSDGTLALLNSGESYTPPGGLVGKVTVHSQGLDCKFSISRNAEPPVDFTVSNSTVYASVCESLSVTQAPFSVPVALALPFTDSEKYYTVLAEILNPYCGDFDTTITHLLEMIEARLRERVSATDESDDGGKFTVHHNSGTLDGVTHEFAIVDDKISFTVNKPSGRWDSGYKVTIKGVNEILDVINGVRKSDAFDTLKRHPAMLYAVLANLYDDHPEFCSYQDACMDGYRRYVAAMQSQQTDN